MAKLLDKAPAALLAGLLAFSAGIPQLDISSGLSSALTVATAVGIAVVSVYAGGASATVRKLAQK